MSLLLLYKTNPAQNMVCVQKTLKLRWKKVLICSSMYVCESAKLALLRDFKIQKNLMEFWSL